MTLSTDTGSRSVSASLLRPDRRPPAVLTDFDDTAAVQNVAELLLHRFGHPTWTDVRERFRRGELSLKDYQEIAFREMRGDKAAMQSYVRENACFRGHFDELAQFCQDHSIPMCIVNRAWISTSGFAGRFTHPHLPVQCRPGQSNAKR